MPSGHLSFFDLPEQYRSGRARFTIVPVPFDGTSTWKKGADQGPRALLDASTQVELYDIETGTEPYREGIAAAGEVRATGDVESMVESVGTVVASVLESRSVPVVVGGEHSVSIGAIRAAASSAGGELTVLQLDAHADLRDEYEGSKLNHACVMARARELCPAIAVGIRSMDRSEAAPAKSMPVWYAHEIVGRADWPERVAKSFDGPVYITIDLDVFDPSIMPSTGTPEPGGLGWYEVLALLRSVTETHRVLGFDVVELCPDGSHAAEFLAAKLVYKLMSYIVASGITG
jgi:agmatinase